MAKIWLVSLLMRDDRQLRIAREQIGPARSRSAYLTESGAGSGGLPSPDGGIERDLTVLDQHVRHQGIGRLFQAADRC